MRQAFCIFYDGGYQPDYGAYGSYVVVSPTEGVITQAGRKLRFHGTQNNHAAEYRTLRRALDSLFKSLKKRKISPQDCFVYFYGDNRVVQQQCNGKAKCISPVSKIMNGEVGKRLSRLAGYESKIMPRHNIKLILGH